MTVGALTEKKSTTQYNTIQYRTNSDNTEHSETKLGCNTEHDTQHTTKHNTTQHNTTKNRTYSDNTEQDKVAIDTGRRMGERK